MCNKTQRCYYFSFFLRLQWTSLRLWGDCRTSKTPTNKWEDKQQWYRQVTVTAVYDFHFFNFWIVKHVWGRGLSEGFIELGDCLNYPKDFLQHRSTTRNPYFWYCRISYYCNLDCHKLGCHKLKSMTIILCNIMKNISLIRNNFICQQMLNQRKVSATTFKCSC